MAAQWGSYLAPTIVDGQVASNSGYHGGLYTFDTATNLVDGSTVFQRTIGAYGQISTDGSRLYVVASGAISAIDLAGNFQGTLEVASQTLVPPLILTQTHVIATTADRARTAMLDLAGQQRAVLLDRGGPMALADGLLVVAAFGGIYAYDVAESLFADGFESN